MDMYDFNSSDEKEDQMDNHSSSGRNTGTQTLSTDHDRSQHQNKKSKIIKKSYQPIRDGNLYVRYQDDPVQYKRLRKKIQNRESAARVRGRKKGNMENLQVEVQHLKKVNSELMLRNATLQTENRSLKNQIQFLRGIVKPSTKQNDLASSDNIDKYLNLSPKKKDSEMKPQQHYQSPFDEDDSALNWIRSSASSGSRSNWSTLFVLTIVVCVFVLPSDSPDGTIIAQQTGSAVVSQTSSLIQIFLHYGKYCAKYLILLAYLFFAGCFVYGKFNNKKMKKILKMV